MTTQELIRQIRISILQYDRTRDDRYLKDIDGLIAYKKATARNSDKENISKEIIPHA